jgi:hypothetical protein
MSLVSTVFLLVTKSKDWRFCLQNFNIIECQAQEAVNRSRGRWLIFIISFLFYLISRKKKFLRHSTKNNLQGRFRRVADAGGRTGRLGWLDDVGRRAVGNSWWWSVEEFFPIFLKLEMGPML